jgi:hypothetical protein
MIDAYLRILRGVDMETSCFSDVRERPIERIKPAAGGRGDR